MPNHLTKADIEWALNHLVLEGDTDLFPRAFEIAIMNDNRAATINEVQRLDLLQHRWCEPRRALIPKDDLSFRSGAQLEPFDALLFAALVKNVCKIIDKHRGDQGRTRIFSYRLRPTMQGRLYEQDRYKMFWGASGIHARNSGFVLVTDISDFYNQVYHHTVEQELDSAGVRSEAKKSILNLLKVCSITTSRGLPIGPHATHLLAEVSLRQIDDMLVQAGAKYIRFVDDFHIFCQTKKDAYRLLNLLAQTLDLVKLQLNKSKTKIISASEWIAQATSMVEDRPISISEAEILDSMKMTSNNPYAIISVNKTPASLSVLLTEPNINEIFDAYLAEEEPDFIRLRWFIRRLTQVQTPAAVNFIVKNFERLAPAIADSVRYLRGSIGRFNGDHAALGDMLLNSLDGPVISANPYLKTMVFSLFANISLLNHVPRLIEMFDSATASSQREIVLAASNARAVDWLRSLKGLNNQDPWVRRAIIVSAAGWATDEHSHWAKSQKGKYDFLDDLMIDALTAPSKTEKMINTLKKKLKSDTRQVK